ncbi:MAG: pyridoxal phosphate-dependent aminotransferase [Janthinobacterium lividum]
MQFSRRTGWESGENDWAAAIRARRSAGREVIDLTVSNPTACGLGPDEFTLLGPLAHPGALLYTPDPFGMQSAREAVAAYYRDHGAEVEPGRVCLTTSTSEAYSFVFRLLCDPGDEVLIARPSYPLFDLLAQLDDVALRQYPLRYDPGAVASGHGGWEIDFAALSAAITERTRAIVAVHPNNPTGNYVSAADRAALQNFCAEHDLALIVDEVFLDYALIVEPGLEASFVDDQSPCLCFVLSGLSKICALPQMKLSWMAACGPQALVERAMERLEIIADTFLSVNAPIQFALPSWLASRKAVQERIRQRLKTNLQTLDRRLTGSLASRMSVEGGWTVVLRVPSIMDKREFAFAALERGVVVQPGEFYGLPAGRCVLSLLTPPEIWIRGLKSLPFDG